MSSGRSQSSCGVAVTYQRAVLSLLSSQLTQRSVSHPFEAAVKTLGSNESDGSVVFDLSASHRSEDQNRKTLSAP